MKTNIISNRGARSRICIHIFPVFVVGLLLWGVGAATCHADILYVSNFSNNTIEKFTSDGVGSVFANTGLNRPEGVAFDSDNSLYVANSGNNTIEKFTSDGISAVFADNTASVSNVSGANGLAFDKAGILYSENSQ